MSSRHQYDDPSQHDVARLTDYRDPTPSSVADRPAQETGGVLAPGRDQRPSPAPDTSLQPPLEGPAT